MNTMTGDEAEALLADVHDGEFGFEHRDATDQSETLFIRASEEQHGLNIATVSDRAHQWPAVRALLLASPRLAASVVTLTRERDAYKRAKDENDDRFMGERDSARQERDEAKALVAEVGDALHQLRCDVADLEKQRDGLTDQCKDLHYAHDRWHHNSMFLARAVAAARPEAADIAAFMLDDTGLSSDVVPGKENVVGGWWALWLFESFAGNMRKPDGSWWNSVELKLRVKDAPAFTITIQRENGLTHAELLRLAKSEAESLRSQLEVERRYRRWHRALDQANTGTSACFDADVLAATAARNVTLHAYGKLLRTTRVDLGKTMGDVADLLGIPVPELSSVERSEEPPFAADKTELICAFLGCESAALLEAAAKAEELLGV